MYAYIPSPYGGRLPSYALAKADKPKEPKVDKPEEPKVDKPEEPKAEEPAKVEEPKPTETKTEPKASETKTEETPSSSPAPETPKVQTESHEQKPSEPKEESKVPPKWPKRDSRYDWETVYNMYSGLTPAQQEAIDDMFDDVEGPEDVKAAVSRIAQFSRVPYLTLSSDPKMLKLMSVDPTVAETVQRNRDRAAQVREEKGDHATDKLTSSNYDPSHANGQGEKQFILLDDLRQGKDGTLYGAMPVANAQKRQEVADKSSKEFGELQRGDIRTLNEIKNYPGNPDRVNVALNARGQTRYGGKLGEDYGETSVYSIDTVDDGKGGTKEVRNFRYDGPSVSLGDTGLSFGQRMRDDGMGLEGVLFNTASGRVVDYDDLDDTVKEKLGPAEHGMVPTNNDMYGGPNSQHLLRDAWGYFGNKEELASRNPAITTKEKEPEPEITDIGSGLTFGNGVNEETGKPERKFYLNGAKRPLKDEDMGNLTPEQQALITYHTKYPNGPTGRMYRLKSEGGKEELLRSNGYVEDRYMGAKPSNKPRLVGGAFFMPVLDREGREVALVPVDPDKYRLPREKRETTGKYRMAPTGKKERFELFPEEHQAVNKSATMTIRDMQMPSISDMIHDRRLRSAPYPSVTPLGRALP